MTRVVNAIMWLLVALGWTFALLGLIFLLAPNAHAQTLPAPTRTTPYDWQCQDEVGNRISDHQRYDTAYVACWNAANGHRVTGGTYRLNKPTTAPPPPPPPPATNIALLSWTPPTTNTDGSALTNLAGYRIHYGTAPGAMTQTLQLDVPGATAFEVANLATGTWYFAMRAYTSAGAESVLSNITSKVIP